MLSERLAQSSDLSSRSLLLFLLYLLLTLVHFPFSLFLLAFFLSPGCAAGRGKFIDRNKLSRRRRTTSSTVAPQSDGIRELIAETFQLRVASQISRHGLEMPLVINFDQTGVLAVLPVHLSVLRCLLHSVLLNTSFIFFFVVSLLLVGVALFSQPVYTYDKRGVRHVPIAGRGKEKSAVTAVLATAADGTVLPAQIIFKGKTPRSISKLALSRRYVLAYVRICVS